MRARRLCLKTIDPQSKSFLVMRRLYRLQQRLAITTPEASALLFIAFVLLVGFSSQHFGLQKSAFGAEDYTSLHEDFAARSAAEPDSGEAVVAVDSTDEAATASPAPRSRRSAKQPPVRMNLNTASERLLQRLPRVGPKIAERIIAYREAHGPFAEPSHIVRVRGIGPKTYEQMEPYLFVDEADLESETTAQE